MTESFETVRTDSADTVVYLDTLQRHYLSALREQREQYPLQARWLVDECREALELLLPLSRRRQSGFRALYEDRGFRDLVTARLFVLLRNVTELTKWLLARHLRKTGTEPDDFVADTYEDIFLSLAQHDLLQGLDAGDLKDLAACRGRFMHRAAGPTAAEAWKDLHQAVPVSRSVIDAFQERYMG